MTQTARPKVAARRRANAPTRAWQRMLSGRRLDLLDPSPFDVEIEDIAHGLARVARWNGQTIGDNAFSVAQHCVLVEALAAQLQPDLSREERLSSLLHDAAEYVIGDMISPFKTAIGGDYKQVEARLDSAIRLRFGLSAQMPAELKILIKRADHICAYFEATQLAGFSAQEAAEFFGAPPVGLSLTLTPEPAPIAQAGFLARYRALLA
jgi:5'-deoxynucleotidase YfbR-like HD superfamily hydrolase